MINSRYDSCIPPSLSLFLPLSSSLPPLSPPLSPLSPSLSPALSLSLSLGNRPSGDHLMQLLFDGLAILNTTYTDYG